MSQQEGYEEGYEEGYDAQGGQSGQALEVCYNLPMGTGVPAPSLTGVKRNRLDLAGKTSRGVV